MFCENTNNLFFSTNDFNNFFIKIFPFIHFPKTALIQYTKTDITLPYSLPKAAFRHYQDQP